MDEKLEIKNERSETVSREEILKKRAERKHQKQEEKRLIKQKDALHKKLQPKTDKLKLIPVEELEKYNQPQVNKPPKRRNKTLNSSFNLLDYIIKRKKQNKPVKQINKSPTIKLNKGKKRETPKKKYYSRLRRTVLLNRELKKTQDLKTLEEKILDLSIEEKPKPKIHSRSFRPYCNNTTSPEICTLTEQVLSDIFRFQSRAYEKNQIKARAHKRYVVGFKETRRQLLVDKVKLVIIAPDCEPCDLPDGIDDTVASIKEICKTNEVPYLFSLKRRQLSKIMMKKVPISCIAILSYDGTNEKFKELIKCLEKERENYLQLTSE